MRGAVNQKSWNTLGEIRANRRRQLFIGRQKVSHYDDGWRTVIATAFVTLVVGLAWLAAVCVRAHGSAIGYSSWELAFPVSIIAITTALLIFAILREALYETGTLPKHRLDQTSAHARLIGEIAYIVEDLGILTPKPQEAAEFSPNALARPYVVSHANMIGGVNPPAGPTVRPFVGNLDGPAKKES
ncbi:hypothetical protein [Dactylosporangium sp. CA-139066]|uniref:hypothetical protein n=1 Tax=Dactylosporangium sp. CA-139066 TaxID=3239930 RepID=UPI003D9356AC